MFNLLLSGHRTETDEAVHEYFDKDYTVVDFTDREHAYAQPKVINAFEGASPKFVDNRCVSGKVAVAYVITATGRVTSAYALESSDPTLAKAVVERMVEWRYRAPQMDGDPVSIIQVTELVFTCS